jgi:hypothetical protein
VTVSSATIWALTAGTIFRLGSGATGPYGPDMSRWVVLLVPAARLGATDGAALTLGFEAPLTR